MNKELLITIAKDYDLKEFIEDLNYNENETLVFGFLGEFSSGKSSLINALIGNELLSENVSPTTSNITFIEVANTENEVKYCCETLNEGRVERCIERFP